MNKPSNTLDAFKLIEVIDSVAINNRRHEQLRSGRLSTRERGELGEVLLNALEGLDEKHREVFIMKEVEGRSHEEIAGMLNIPEGTVWSRLSYARRGLRQRLLRSQEGLGLPSER